MSASKRGLLRGLQFVLERWVQRGILPQLLLMASLVASVAVVGGCAAWAFTPAFESLPTAIWWSFLRLTDPGYLGDDEGVVLRVVSTVVTVLGYVLFMGSLIAIMTQWLARIIRKLESGLTPIAMQHHFVILGWTNRTSEIIKKLLSAGGRLDRFFAKRTGAGRLRVVVLADEVNAERRLELRESLGADWNESQVFLRSGSSLQQEHLERLDLSRAAVVMIPGADFELGGAEMNDTRIVKTLLNLDALFRKGRPGSKPPCVVAELFDPRKVSIARSSISTRTEIIAGDRLVSRLLSQSLRHPGVGTVLLRLLTHREGNGLYLRAFPQFAGASPRALSRVFPEAVVLGCVSMEGDSPRVHLDPMEDVVLGESDLLIFIAATFDNCRPSAGSPEPLAPRTQVLAPSPKPERQRFLILGWSYKIPTLLAELLESDVHRSEVTMLSRVGADVRNQALAHLDFGDRLEIRNVEGDYSLEHDLRKLEPHSFDHVLFLASGYMQSSDEADARTVLGLLLLRSLLKGHDPAPDILVELLDPDNASILGEAADVVFVSPRMLSHLLAHVGLVPELNAVFDELICAGGAEIELRRASDLGLTAKGLTFAKVQDAAVSLGCVGLGFYAKAEGPAPRQVHLNPARDRTWVLGKGDRVILLSSQQGGATEE